jgi:hypothetical protein
MTPKEKAVEIFNKMCNEVDELLPLDVKECALVAVDEILKSKPCKFDGYYYELNLKYWTEVKQEIEKL